MNPSIEGNSYGAVISPNRINYKVGHGYTQIIRDAVLIGTKDDKVNYGNTQTTTDLILQMPMLNNNGAYMATGALLLQVPDGTQKGGNARGNGAVDLQTYRTNPNQVASGSQSVTLGALNLASGASAVAMGNANTANGEHSIAMGYYCYTDSASAVAMGYSSYANGFCSVAIGAISKAYGYYSLALGYSCHADGYYSAAIGSYGSTNNISSKVAIGTAFSTSSGAYQMGQLGLGAITADATPTVLLSDTTSVSESSQCTLQNNNAVSFTIEVVARNTDTGNAGRWEAKGLIKRGDNASTTALVGTPTVTLTNGDNESWINASAVTLSADTTYGALAVTVTGADSTNIDWMCRINTVEVL